MDQGVGWSLAGLYLDFWASLDESCPPPDTRGCLHLPFASSDLVSLSSGLSQGSYLLTPERVGLPNRYGRLDEACFLRWYVHCHLPAFLLSGNLVSRGPHALPVVFPRWAQSKSPCSCGPVFALGGGGVGENSLYTRVSLVPIIGHSVGEARSFTGILLRRWMGCFLLSGLL